MHSDQHSKSVAICQSIVRTFASHYLVNKDLHNDNESNRGEVCLSVELERFCHAHIVQEEFCIFLLTEPLRH